MKKRQNKQKQFKKYFFGLGFILIGAIVAFVTILILFPKNLILTDTQQGGLFQQDTTTSVTTTRKQTVVRQSMETTTHQTTTKPETTRIEKPYRLDALGNSNLEFKTVEEAYQYGASVLEDAKAVQELADKNYSGYVVRLIRWSDNSLTYTIDWQ